MLKAYEKISHVWNDFPEELNGLKLYQDVNRLKNIFQKQRTFFEYFLIKIVIIGEPSTGKSTLINSLIERKIFGTTAGHGTSSFFYCSATPSSYEYFTINDTHEIRNIDILQNATALNNELPSFINEYSVVKVYIHEENNTIFRFRTVIVDCPGLEKKASYDKEIRKHCDNTDMFLFVFNIEHGATDKNKKYIGEILETFRKPACFFVYNKCDKILFDEIAMQNVREQFFKGFESKYAMNLKIGGEPLYFISAEQEFQKTLSKKLDNEQFLKENSQKKKGLARSILETAHLVSKTDINDSKNCYNDICKTEYDRLKADIITHKNVSYIRIQNVVAELTVEVRKYLAIISEVLKSEKQSKKKMATEYKAKCTEKNQTTIFCEKLRNDILTLKNDAMKRIREKDFITMIRDIIGHHAGTCTKDDANLLIKKMSESIEIQIKSTLNDNLNNYLRSPIENKLKDPILNRKFQNWSFQMDVKNFVPTYVNVEYGFFCWGDKTNDVKDIYTNFLSSRSGEIKDSVIWHYQEQLNKYSNNIEIILKQIIKEEEEKTSSTVTKTVNQDDLIGHLEKYEKAVLKTFDEYQSLLVQ